MTDTCEQCGKSIQWSDRFHQWQDDRPPVIQLGFRLVIAGQCEAGPRSTHRPRKANR